MPWIQSRYMDKGTRLHGNIGHRQVMLDHRHSYYLGSNDVLLDTAHCL